MMMEFSCEEEEGYGCDEESSSAGGVYEGWTEYFMKWSGFYCFLESYYCPLRRSNRLLVVYSLLYLTTKSSN